MWDFPGKGQLNITTSQSDHKFVFIHGSISNTNSNCYVKPLKSLHVWQTHSNIMLFDESPFLLDCVAVVCFFFCFWQCCGFKRLLSKHSTWSRTLCFYCLNHTSSLFASFIFQIGSPIFAWASLNVDPPTYAWDYADYKWSTSGSFVEMGDLANFCLSLLQITILLIPVSWVAGNYRHEPTHPAMCWLLKML
jgi:hypothetical protein